MTEVKSQPPFESNDETRFDDKVFSATQAIAGLCTAYNRFIDTTAGQKAVSVIYRNRHTENLDIVIQTAQALRVQPLSVDMLFALFEFVEDYTGISIETNIAETFKKNFEYAGALWQKMQQLHISQDNVLQIIVQHETLAKKSTKHAKQFELSILEMRSAAEVGAYLLAMERRIVDNTICVTKELTTTPELDPQPREDLDQIPASKRLEVSNGPLHKLLLTVNLLSEKESVYLFSTDQNVQPTKITKKGHVTIPMPAGSIIKVHTATETQLFSFNKTKAELVPLGFRNNDPDLDAILQLVFDKLWHWHVSEFEQVDATLLHSFSETLNKLPSRKNTGALKSTLRELLESIEPLGFPLAATIEIMDRVDGMNGRGMVIDQNVMALLEEKAKLDAKSWEFILDNCRDKQVLLDFFQGDSFSHQLSEIERKYVLKRIEGAIPSHSIANMVQLLTNHFPLEPKLSKDIADLCYYEAAQATQVRLSYDTFREQVKAIITTSEKYSEVEIADILKKQDMTLRWIHAKLTKNFSGLASEHLKKVTALSMTDTVKVSEIPTPRLRYDLEQKALIIKASLAETLPHDLHQYLQLRSLQGSFDREYCLHIEHLPNHAYLESLLRVELEPKDKKKNYIPAEKITKALFRYHLSSEAHTKNGESAQQTLSLAARKLAQDILANPTNDVISYFKENMVMTEAFKKLEREGKTDAIFSNVEQLQALCMSIFSTHTHEPTSEGQRFQRLLTSILWKISTNLSSSFSKNGVRKPKDTIETALFSLFSQAEVTVEGFHGWGANDETLVPFVRPLAMEIKKPLMLVANNYMGASGSNMYQVPNLAKPLSFKGRGQDMIDYGMELVDVLAELDGIPHGKNTVLGHSMGGQIAGRAAVDHGEDWGETSYLALEPVAATSESEIPDPNDPEKIITHYISLLGASSEETRPLAKKIAAIITKLVTSPEDLPDLIQSALVYLGRIKVNATVYNQLVEGSNPRVALAHYMELIRNRIDFHTHVTPILQENEAFSPEEKSYIATKLANKMKIVIAKNDDVLKHEFALWEFLEDPAVPVEHRAALAKMLVIISGNHYGHLENKVYPGTDNPENLRNTTIVARGAALLVS